MLTIKDYPVGRINRFGRYEMTREEVLEFAERFDPQPFHLDEAAAAANPIFGRIAASGWHTVSATMRMIVDHGKQYAGHSLGGASVDELRWLKPVYPGDILSAENEVVAVNAPKSRTDIAFVKLKTTTYNQNDEAVMTMFANIIVSSGQP